MRPKAVTEQVNPGISYRLLLRPKEAFELLGLSRSKGYQLIEAGELPSIRIGRAVRVPLGELQQWVSEKLTK